MPAPNEHERSFEVRTLSQTDTSITVAVGRGDETVVFTYIPPSKVEVDFSGKAGAADGPCSIFGGKLVNAKGWCTAWVKKA